MDAKRGLSCCNILWAIQTSKTLLRFSLDVPGTCNKQSSNQTLKRHSGIFPSHRASKESNSHPDCLPAVFQHHVLCLLWELHFTISCKSWRLNTGPQTCMVVFPSSLRMMELVFLEIMTPFPWTQNVMHVSWLKSQNLKLPPRPLKP